MYQKTTEVGAQRHVAKKLFITLMAIAGAYVAYRKMQESQDAIKDWLDEAHEEIERKSDKLKEVTKREYGHIVDTVLEHYATLYHINKRQLARAAADLKEEWVNAREELKNAPQDDEE